MYKIHIVALLIFVSHVSLSMEFTVYVAEDFGWMEVDDVDAYELLSYAFPIFMELFWICVPWLLNYLLS